MLQFAFWISGEELLMTYKEMQKLMDFIRKMNARTDRKLRRLGLMAATTSWKHNPRDDQWGTNRKKGFACFCAKPRERKAGSLLPERLRYLCAMLKPTEN